MSDTNALGLVEAIRALPRPRTNSGASGRSAVSAASFSSAIFDGTNRAPNSVARTEQAVGEHQAAFRHVRRSNRYRLKWRIPVRREYVPRITSSVAEGRAYSILVRSVA